MNFLLEPPWISAGYREFHRNPKQGGGDELDQSPVGKIRK